MTKPRPTKAPRASMPTSWSYPTAVPAETYERWNRQSQPSGCFARIPADHMSPLARMLAADLVIREAERLREYTAITVLAEIARTYYRAVEFNPVTLGRTLRQIEASPGGVTILRFKRKGDGFYVALTHSADAWQALCIKRDEYGNLAESGQPVAHAQDAA